MDGMQSYAHHNTQFFTYFDFCDPSVDSKYSFTNSVKIKDIAKNNKYNASSFFDSTHQRTAIMYASQFTVA